MTYTDFQNMNVKVSSIGRYFTINSIEYRLIYCIGYGWIPPRYNENAYEKIINETIEGVNINLQIWSKYTLGPSGPSAEISGNICDTQIKVRAFFNGTVAHYDEIENITIGDYFIHSHYGLNEFYLTIFKKQSAIVSKT